jgi:hypothetical protein
MPEISGDYTPMFDEDSEEAWAAKVMAELDKAQFTPSIQSSLASIAQSLIIISQRQAQ